MLILASSSPQRRAILERLGVRFEVVVPEVEELRDGAAVEVARENALRKARAVERRLARAAEIDGGPAEGVARAGPRESAAGLVVLGADTVVALDGKVYGKPDDEAQARAMLSSLAGRTHTVVGAVTILAAGEQRHLQAETRVRFRPLDDEMLDWYLSTGEWRGRAGGYAIQGAGSALVTEVLGDYENVVGLPVAALLDACPRLLWP